MARESSLRNMVFTLTAISVISSAILGGVYVATKEPINAAKIAKTNSAIAKVLPEFNNDPSHESSKVKYKEKEYTVYPASKDGIMIGYAIESYTSAGFGGRIVIMVGILESGTIYKTSVISHSETPGLGDKMVEGKSDFSKQFENIFPSNLSGGEFAVKKDGGDFDAITASTISSRAFCDALNSAYGVFEAIKNESKNE